MLRRVALHLLLLLLGFVASACAAEAPPRPNIIFILADDFGYGDYGLLFQNARREAGERSKPWHATPHLDRLGREGIAFSRHYCAAPVCAPSRASFLTGVHQGHAQVRDNQFDKALEENHTVASVLRAAGYATAAIGKWGLQGEGDAPVNWPAYPTKRGFDFYHGYVRHKDGHAHYPKENGKQVWENEREISAELAGCYTTDLFTARAKKWIAEQRTSAQGARPFFLYLAYDTPHAKLQLPPGSYPSGGGLKGGVQWTGEAGRMLNTADGQIDSYLHPDYAEATWDHDRDPQTAEVPWPEVQKRYSTGVRRIDDAVGDLLQLLADLEIDGETLVVFTTDNGPSKESYLKENYDPTFFGSYGPFDGIKRDLWEGGIRVGAMVRWPGGIPAGRVTEFASSFWDWMPTFAALAGIGAPARSDGVSLAPLLAGRTDEQAQPILYSEYAEGQRTPNYRDFEPGRRGRLRRQMQVIGSGPWMGVRYDVKSHGDPFEIYNVLVDPKQTKNLAAQLPELQQQMHDAALQRRRPNASAPRPYDDEMMPASTGPAGKGGAARWTSKRTGAPWPVQPAFGAVLTRGGGLPGEVNQAAVGADAIEYSGFIEASADGEYTFSLPAGAFAVFRLHNAVVIDAGYAPAREEVSGVVRLKAGRHRFTLSASLRDGRAAPVLSWSSAAIETQAIPARAFSE